MTETTPTLQLAADAAPAREFQPDEGLGKLDDWAIDRSTASPILTYQTCSVIQDDQAFAVLDLVKEKLAAAGESVTVPRMPTEAMLVAANDLLHDHPHETSLNVYRAMIAAAPVLAPTAAVPWRDMATAPRDGTHFLGSGLDFGEGPRRHFAVCFFLESVNAFVEVEEGDELDHLDSWVPLPDTPAGRGTAEAGEAEGEPFAYALLDHAGGLVDTFDDEETASEAARLHGGRTVRALYVLPPALAQLQADNERLMQERDNWRKSFETMNAKAISNARERNAAEARAKDLRGRLEKAEAALTAADQMASSCINFLERLNPFEMPGDDEQQYHAALDGCRVHYPATRRAALAGDVQEAGR